MTRSNASGTAPNSADPQRARERLYRRLGYTGPIPSATARARSGLESTPARVPDPDRAAEPPPLDPAAIAALRERLRVEPDQVLAQARALWDAELGLEELEAAVDEAGWLVDDPELGLRRLEARDALERVTPALPPEFFQDWPYDETIEIDPASTRFEAKADALRWVIFGGPALLGSMSAKKAPFAWHHRHASGFVYVRPEPSPSESLSLGLVSDFGTGLYTSKYIAKQLEDRKYPYIIHGGDVYYAGRKSEFETNFEPQIDPLLAQSQVFTMNANHEMYSLGEPYFAYIAERKRRHSEQLQEGSYFCLRFGTTLQLVGIDTAYFRDGRHDEPGLQRWLQDVLAYGREVGAVNVLFSPNEPYAYGSTALTPLLREDLDDIVRKRTLVDLWFWGNTHYCALFDRTPSLPFVGSCIGHGGYPYGRMSPGRPSAAPVRFLEKGARFPAWTGVRQDRGNNGFCELTVHADRRIDLCYRDWMSRTRCIARLAFDAGVYRLTTVREESAAEQER